MSSYLRNAQNHVERIEYYNKHAGPFGYSQARYHDLELSKLLIRANNSKQGKSDVELIQAIIKKSRPMMDEMLLREKAAKPAG